MRIGMRTMAAAAVWAIAAAIAVDSVGCQNNKHFRAGDNAAEVSASESKKGTVAHVVLFWLKTPGDAVAIRQIIETSETFRQIPGVIDLTVGRPIPSTRPVVDSSFDVGLVITFTDEAALQAYEVHPIHAAAVKGTLRPLTAKIQVYDVKQQ